MDGSQLYFDWEKRDRDLSKLKEHLESLEFQESDVALLLVVAAEDGQREAASYARKSKQQWALAMGVRSRNTPVKAMKRLATRGVLAWDADRTGHEILVDWQAVWALEKPQRPDGKTRLKEALDERKTALVTGVVTGGHTCARVLVKNKKDRVRDVNRVLRVTRAPEARLVRPWARRGGLTGDDLRSAVQDRDRQVLSRLYGAAVEAGYWEDCEDHRVRFLSLCHHAATRAEEPMALLVALCRRDDNGTVLRSERVRDVSRDWAADTRRHWRRESSDLREAFAEAERERHTRSQLVAAAETV